MAFTERAQILLTPEQHSRLTREAERRGISVGALIREAIDAHMAPRRSRTEALKALFELEGPVGDWEDMEREIIEGAVSDLP